MKALNAQPYHSSPFRSAAAVGNTVATAMPSTAIVNIWVPMLSGCLTLTAMDAPGRWCRAALELPDPHFRLTRCLSSDLSVAREHPAEAPSLAAGVTSGEPDRTGPITVLSVLVGELAPSHLWRGHDDQPGSGQPRDRRRDRYPQGPARCRRARHGGRGPGHSVVLDHSGWLSGVGSLDALLRRRPPGRDRGHWQLWR